MLISAGTALLRLEKVESGYGRARALHGISLVVGAGEAIALIGANGAGKSTILRAISGLNPVFAGSIQFEGAEIGNMAPRQIVRMGIAHCPEERKIWPDLTVLEHLELGATARGRPRRPSVRALLRCERPAPSRALLGRRPGLGDGRRPPRRHRSPAER